MNKEQIDAVLGPASKSNQPIVVRYHESRIIASKNNLLFFESSVIVYKSRYSMKLSLDCFLVPKVFGTPRNDHITGKCTSSNNGQDN